MAVLYSCHLPRLFLFLIEDPLRDSLASLAMLHVAFYYSPYSANSHHRENHVHHVAKPNEPNQNRNPIILRDIHYTQRDEDSLTSISVSARQRKIGWARTTKLAVRITANRA